MVALAHHWRGLIRSGVVKDQAALAALVGISRARVTQVMDLLHLTPEIQEEILFLSSDDRSESLRHRDLLPVAAEPAWPAQRRIWRLLRPE